MSGCKSGSAGVEPLPEAVGIHHTGKRKKTKQGWAKILFSSLSSLCEEQRRRTWMERDLRGKDLLS